MRWLIVLGTLGLTGCGTNVTYTPTNRPPRALVRHSVQSVDVFSSGRPSRPHVEVGILEATQQTRLSVDETPEIIATLREQAAALGCDALVILGSADTVQDNVIVAN